MNSRRVFVTGEVLHTGPMVLLPHMTVLQALAQAGFTQFANPKNIYVLRTENGKQEKLPFNYKEVVKGNHAGTEHRIETWRHSRGPVRNVMSKHQSIWILGMLAFALSGAWAQDTSTPPATEAPPQSTPQEPVPAYGQDNAPAPISENPPLSGLDLPSLEPHAAPLSYFQPGATFSESADSNIGSELGSGSFNSVSRALGSVILKRLWSNYDLGLDYVGGVGYYDIAGQGFKALQQMDLDQKITWKRGQLSLRDSFSYLPEGNFGGAYGSMGSQGISSLGNTAFGGFWGGSSLGTLGLAPRILNVSLADISENLTPKSAITVAGGYAFTHFYGNDISTGAPFIGSSQVSAQVGIQPDPLVAYPDSSGLWISRVRFFNLWDCISFPHHSGHVRTPDFRTDGFIARSGAADHSYQLCK